MSDIRPNGYIKFYNRNTCELCEFFEEVTPKPPIQPKNKDWFCTKITPKFEIDLEDCCDEFEGYES